MLNKEVWLYFPFSCASCAPKQVLGVAVQPKQLPSELICFVYSLPFFSKADNFWLSFSISFGKRI